VYLPYVHVQCVVSCVQDSVEIIEEGQAYRVV
jgi:hypothetical protein